MSEERSARAGESESASEEMEFGSGNKVDSNWILDRALEIDSHQDCIGSLLLLLLLEFVVVVGGLPLGWLVWEDEEVVEEEEGDPPGMTWRKSMRL